MARILIIDDCESAVLTFSALLRLDGFETVTAVDPRAGMDFALSTSFDVVLVDVRLQDSSGIDVIRELKAGGVMAPIVAITAFPDIDSSFDAGSCGAAGYVEGPLFGDDLSEVVRQALAGVSPVLHPSRRPARDVRAVSSFAVAACKPCELGMDRRVRELMRILDIEPWLCTAALADQLDLSESRLRHIFAASTRVPLAQFLPSGACNLPRSSSCTVTTAFLTSYDA